MILFTASLFVPFVPAGASAESQSLSNYDVLRPAPELARTGFVSEDLLTTATELVQHGIRLKHASGHGTLYLHFKPESLGGVLSIRYRR